MLVRAARDAGARRIVAQSISFVYRPGPGVRTEADPLWTDAKGQIGASARPLDVLESETLGDAGVEGVVLRYGTYYGPGTYVAPGGLYATLIAKRVLPVPGSGGGLFGLVHIDDAVSATVVALDGPVGVFNVTDGVPARGALEWMPFVAALLGAKAPFTVPPTLARIAAGPFMTYLMCEQPAVSNVLGEGRARVGARLSRLARGPAPGPREGENLMRQFVPWALLGLLVLGTASASGSGWRQRRRPVADRQLPRGKPSARSDRPDDTRVLTSVRTTLLAVRRWRLRADRGSPPARSGRSPGPAGSWHLRWRRTAAGPAPPRNAWAPRLVRKAEKCLAPPRMKTNDGANDDDAPPGARRPPRRRRSRPRPRSAPPGPA